MNEMDFQKLKETSWRRRLTTREKAALNSYFAVHPEARTQWEDESELSDLLGKLPDAPVSTNFTARVLQESQRGERWNSPIGHGAFHWLRFNWMPRIALASLVVFIGLLSLQQYKRTQIALDVAAVSSAATAALPQQWLEDFDAIRSLSPQPVDNELLAALQ